MNGLRLLGRFGGRAGALNFESEAARHSDVAKLLGEDASLFKNLDRARYPALAEQDSGLAKNSRVACTLFGRIHERKTTCGKRR